MFNLVLINSNVTKVMYEVGNYEFIPGRVIDDFSFV